MRRPLCADLSREIAEPLAATASYIEHWILLEYRGLWPSAVLRESVLAEPVKAHLRAQLAALPRSRLLFIRRSERRKQGTYALYFGRTSTTGHHFYGLDFDAYDELVELDLAGALLDHRGVAAGAPLEHPLLVVCTHGKRDRCCAKYGRVVYDAVRAEVEPYWVWQSTHVGGDRFAGNLVCFPEGLYFGRVERADVAELLDEYLEGRIYLERYRGRSCHDFAVQAAERAVRGSTGLTAIDGLALVSLESDGAGWNVRLKAAASGHVHELHVEVELGELTYLTCTSATLKRPRRFTATERLRPGR